MFREGIVLMGTLLSLAVCASSATWTGGAGNGLWSDNGNWSSAHPAGVGDVATFNTTATVALDSSVPTDVSYLKVSGGCLTLTGAGDAGLRLNRTVNVYASGLVVGNAASLVLETPVTAATRIDKWYAGALTLRSTFTSTVNDGYAYGLILGRGTNVIEGAGAVVATTSGLSLGNGDPSSGVPTLLRLKDQASVDARRIWARVAGSGGPIEIEQDGPETRVTTSEVVLGMGANAQEPVRYALRAGTLTVNGWLNIGGLSAGTFAQSGGTATVERLAFSTNGIASRLELTGGRLSFNTYGNSDRAVFAFSGGELETRHSNPTLPAWMELSGRPVFAPKSGSVIDFASGLKIADDTEIVVSGAGRVDLPAGPRFNGALTVDGGHVFLRPGVTVTPRPNDTAPWKVKVCNGGRFQIPAITSRVLAPLDLELSDGGQVYFNHGQSGATTWARSVLVAHRLVLDGVEQPKGRYLADPAAANLKGSPSASVVVCHVWTGAGDGTTWTDPANWADGAVPPNDGTAPVDLSRAAGGTVTLTGETKATCVAFLPSGAQRKLAIAGAGPLVLTGTQGYTAAFVVPEDAEIELDVDLKRVAGFLQSMSVVGGGTLAVRRSYPAVTQTYIGGLPPFAFDGVLAFRGPSVRIDGWQDAGDYKIFSLFTMEAEGSGRVVFEDGCTFAAFRVMGAPDGFIVPREFVQKGGLVTVDDIYLTRHNYQNVTPFAYTLEGGEFRAAGGGVNLGCYYAGQFKHRFTGGAFQMSGGTATVQRLQAECCETYFRLTGGVLNLGAGGFVKSANGANRDASWRANTDAPLQLGGVTIRTTADAEGTLDARFTGIGGDTVFDLVQGDLAIAAATTGAGGFVKKGPKTLTFQGTNTFQGAVTVEEGLVMFSGASALDGMSHLAVTGGRVEIYGSVGTMPGCIELASADGLKLAEGASFTVNRLFVGGVEQTGTVAFGAGAVTVLGADEGAVWTGADGASWSGAGNWLAGAAPTVGAGADFSRAAGKTVVVDTGATLAGLACRAGGTVTLVGGADGILAFRDQAQIVVDQGATLVLDVDVRVGGYLIKVGDGRLVLKRRVVSETPPDELTADTSFLVTSAGETELLGEAEGVRLWTAGDTLTGRSARLVFGPDAVATNRVTVQPGWYFGDKVATYGTQVQQGGVIDMTKILPNFAKLGWWSFSQPEGGTASYVLDDGTLRLCPTVNNFAIWTGSGRFDFVQNGGVADLSGLRLDCEANQTATYTLNGGTLQLTRGFGSGYNGAYTLALNGGRVEVLGTTAPFPGRQAVALGGQVTFATAAGATSTLLCDLAGEGELVYEGPGELVATKMLTGPSRIKATDGTLVLQQPVAATNIVVGGTVDVQMAGALNPEGTLDLLGDGQLALCAGETVVRRLSVNGLTRAAGVYSASVGKTCGGRITGTGMLRVLEGAPAGTYILVR